MRTRRGIALQFACWLVAIQPPLAAAVVSFPAAAYTPPACVDGPDLFSDVDPDHPACPWIEKARLDGTTEGCTAGPGGRFCPDDPVTRAGLAVFVGKAQRRARVAVVAQSGGDYTSPLAAMADVTNWCGVGSQPCVVKLLPGTYNLNQPLTMVPLVDIEGSGEGVTTISAGSGPTIIGATGTELRQLRVSGGGANGSGVYASSVTDFRLTHVKITVGAAFTAGDVRGIDLRQSSAVLTHVSVIADALQVPAIGVANGSGDLVMTHSSILARTTHGQDAYGVLNYSLNGSPASAKLIDVETRGGGLGIANANRVAGFANDCAGCFAWLEQVRSTGGQIGGPAMVDLAFGLWNNSSGRVEIANSYLLGTWAAVDEAGVHNNSTALGAVRMRNSHSDSGIASVANASTGTVYLANNLLKGTLTGGGAGTWHCIGNYDEELAAKSCP